jgi:Uma2 family endonuclease
MEHGPAMSRASKSISTTNLDPADSENGGEPDRKSKARPKARAASFRYGWRYVKTKLPNGRVDFERVPLTLEDVLHPQFGDVHVLSDAHGDDCTYLRDVIRDQYRDDPSVVVFYDVGIFWDVEGIKNHSPDISLIFGVKKRKEWKTFHVKTEKVRPELIIEVTSPDTRVNDLKKKVDEYAIVKVPHYVIVDAEEKENRRRITLLSYRLGSQGYEPQELDEVGRAWLEPVGAWLGVRQDPRTGGDRVALFDSTTGQEIGDYTAISRARVEAEARAHQAEARADEAEARADHAEARAVAEAAARAAAEEQMRLMEAELRLLRGERG